MKPRNQGKEAKGGMSTTCVNVAIEKYTQRLAWSDR